MLNSRNSQSVDQVITLADLESWRKVNAVLSRHKEAVVELANVFTALQTPVRRALQQVAENFHDTFGRLSPKQLQALKIRD